MGVFLVTIIELTQIGESKLLFGRQLVILQRPDFNLGAD